MKEHRKVSGLVTGSKAKRSVVVFVAAVCIHTPLIRTLWHDEKPSVLPIRAPPVHQVPTERQGTRNFLSTRSPDCVDRDVSVRAPLRRQCSYVPRTCQLWESEATPLERFGQQGPVILAAEASVWTSTRSRCCTSYDEQGIPGSDATKMGGTQEA